MKLQLGEILALVGMGVLLLSNMARRRARVGQPVKGGLFRMLAWGDIVSFILILTGLVFMYLNK